MDSAVLLTLGVALGGLATDLVAPRPRNRSVRQWLIETLSKGIRQGITGPLRLAERDDGLYVVGCGLSHRVDSEEEAEELVGILLGELKDVLGSSSLDFAAGAAETETPGAIGEDPAECADTQFTEVPEPACASDTRWEEWPEAINTLHPEALTAPAAVVIVQDQAEIPVPAQTAPDNETPAVPARPEPAVEAAAAPTPAKTIEPPLSLGIGDVDQVLNDIVSQMRACCFAA